jgi:hypothetical protein
VESRSKQDINALKPSEDKPEQLAPDSKPKPKSKQEEPTIGRIKKLAHSNENSEPISISKEQAVKFDEFLGESKKGQKQLIVSLQNMLKKKIQEGDSLKQSASMRHYALVNSDSEAKAIVFLNDESNLLSLINEVKEQDYEIVAIEFHGYTTKDMCALCYTNFNIIQYIANNLDYSNPGINMGFLGRLKCLLIHKNLASKDCQTAIIISSSEEFPAKDAGGNLLWHVLPSPHNSFEYGRVNQFRFQKDEEKGKEKVSEESSPASITPPTIVQESSPKYEIPSPQYLTPKALQIIQKSGHNAVRFVKKTAGFLCWKWTYITPIRLVVKDDIIVEQELKLEKDIETLIKGGKLLFYYKDKENYYPFRIRRATPLPAKAKGTFSPPKEILQRRLNRFKGTKYTVRDAGGGGDCGPLSVLLSLEKNLTENEVRTLREGVAAPMRCDYFSVIQAISLDDKDAGHDLKLLGEQIRRIETMGSYIGPEDFLHIARYIKKCIVLFTNTDGVWIYYVFNATRDQDGKMCKAISNDPINDDSVKRVIERYEDKNAIFIYLKRSKEDHEPLLVGELGLEEV